LRINLLFQPNSLEVLYWTASFYLIIRYIHTGKDGYVLGLGALFGLGLLNKYSAGFFVIGTLVGLLLTPHRRLLRKPAFYYAIGIALVLFLPNLIWQIKHRVPFFHHMRLLAENQLQYVKTSDFLQDQLLLCLPAVFVWTVGLASLFLVPGLRKYALVGIVYLTVLLTLILLHGKNYYTVGLYPGLLAFGGVVWERATARGGRVWLRPALLVIPVAVLLPFLPLAYPVWSPEKTAAFARKFRGTGILRWEDGQNHPLPQDYADMLGWRELTGKVAAAYQTIPAGERRQTAIICANYGQAGAINYYGKKDGLPRAHSSEASYLLWMPDGLRLKNVIVVDDEPDGLSDHFLSFRQTGRVENPYAREKGTFIIVALGADNVIRNAHYREIREKKKQFGL
ncbi:MAG: glycosyltransferase family 39 protein, partial [Ferruginibacter sp.]|nr:glycosyltransferase family 39 protein [Cytophagales bacterium]